jgi:hypothetical protein
MHTIIDRKSLTQEEYTEFFQETILEPEGKAVSPTQIKKTKHKLRKFLERVTLEHIYETTGTDLRTEEAQWAIRVAVHFDFDVSPEGDVVVRVKTDNGCHQNNRNRLYNDTYRISKQELLK